MSKKADYDARLSERIRLMGNPYAKLSLLDDEDSCQQQLDLGQERARLKNLLNPYAYLDRYGEKQVDALGASKNLELVLDEVLACYKPFVAKSEWIKVQNYRSEFLTSAGRSLASKNRIIEKLESLKFSLLPGEQVEFNRALASKIIGQLKELLG